MDMKYKKPREITEAGTTIKYELDGYEIQNKRGNQRNWYYKKVRNRWKCNTKNLGKSRDMVLQKVENQMDMKHKKPREIKGPGTTRR